MLLAIMDIRARHPDLILGKAPEPLVPPDHGCDGETSSIQLADLGRYLSALLGGARTHWRGSFRVPAGPIRDEKDGISNSPLTDLTPIPRRPPAGSWRSPKPAVQDGRIPSRRLTRRSGFGSAPRRPNTVLV